MRLGRWYNNVQVLVRSEESNRCGGEVDYCCGSDAPLRHRCFITRGGVWIIPCGTGSRHKDRRKLRVLQVSVAKVRHEALLRSTDA